MTEKIAELLRQEVWRQGQPGLNFCFCHVTAVTLGKSMSLCQPQFPDWPHGFPGQRTSIAVGEVSSQSVSCLWFYFQAVQVGSPKCVVAEGVSHVYVLVTAGVLVFGEVQIQDLVNVEPRGWAWLCHP